jgi:prepilin peptidase CpaA
MGTPEVVALVIAGVAVATDLRTRRIPNSLTFGAAALALVYHLVTSGVTGGLWSLGGWLAAVFIFLPFFWLGGMGGGDVKLLAAIGAWLLPWPVLMVALWATLAGGVIALLMALATGYLFSAFLNIEALLRHWWHAGFTPHPLLTLETPGIPRLPYALPICIGVMVTLWLR